MAAITMSLQEKVRAFVMQDDTGDGPFGTVGRRPGVHGFWATDFAHAMRAWGCIYGMAFGLARNEEPCESTESVAQRAYDAAWPVFVEFNGGSFDVSEPGAAVA